MKTIIKIEDALEAIDTRWLRAFVAVAEAGNFTAAARACAMTQSGISQHVARLEAALGVELFSRSREGAVLTDAGEHLRGFVERYTASVSELKHVLTRNDQALNGRVRYAMPESCLFADHFAQLLARRAAGFAGVTLAVQIQPMDEVYEAVREGEADFGFVAGTRQDPVFRHAFFCHEEYVLVAPSASLPVTLTARDVAALGFVDYPGFHENFALWFQTHFPRARIPQPHSLRIVGRVGSLFGVMTMVRAGVGATVAPRQCARPLFESHALDLHPRTEQAAHQHEMFIVTRASRTPSPSVARVIQAFLGMATPG